MADGKLCVSRRGAGTGAGLIMDLRAKLQEATLAHEAAARLAEQRNCAVAAEDVLKRTLLSRQFFDYAFQVLELRLRHGQLPGVIALGGTSFVPAAQALDVYKWSIPVGAAQNWRTAGVGVWRPEHPLHAVWQEFEQRCEAAGLTPQWTSVNDMGSYSWYELTVTL